MSNLITIIITGFITVLLGVLLISQVGNVQQAAITMPYATNLSITLAANTATIPSTYVPTRGLIFLGNATTNTGKNTDSLVIGTTINLTDATGVIVTGSGTNLTQGTYNVSFNYRGGQYIEDSTSRTLLSTMTLWMAIAVLLISAAIIYKINPELFK